MVLLVSRYSQSLTKDGINLVENWVSNNFFLHFSAFTMIAATSTQCIALFKGRPNNSGVTLPLMGYDNVDSHWTYEGSNRITPPNNHCHMESQIEWLSCLIHNLSVNFELFYVHKYDLSHCPKITCTFKILTRKIAAHRPGWHFF